MDFRFTEDEQDLIDAAKAVFDGENTPERMRGLIGGEMSDTLWRQFAELGLFGVMASEGNGGLSQSLAVMAGISEAAGYAGLPEPYVEQAGLVVPLLEQMGEVDALAQVLSGDESYSVAHPLVAYHNGADHCAGFITDRIVRAEDTKLTLVKSIDPLRRLFKIDVQGTANPQAEHQGAVLTAAQLVGLSARMVDMSVDYAKDRHQFGKPIGSFQAVKHHLATVYTQIEFTRPMVHLAALQGGRSVHMAKLAAIDTAMLAVETAIQVHGGMGYTFEVDLHMFMKRAWALCGEWGDRSYHMNRLEEFILQDGADLGPGQTFV